MEHLFHELFVRPLFGLFGLAAGAVVGIGIPCLVGYGLKRAFNLDDADAAVAAIFICMVLFVGVYIVLWFFEK